MTPQEWKEVQAALELLYTPVNLNCDGYKVTLALMRTNQFRNAIRIYINGVIKGKWYIEDCEERRRFFRPITKSMLSPKSKAALKKLSKKRKLELETEYKYTYYVPEWNSFAALKRHFIKNNNSIELIRKGV